MVKKQNSGQAFLEWIIFCIPLLFLTFWTFNCARMLLARTAAESWSWIGARHALSNALPPETPVGMKLWQKSDLHLGQSTVVFEGVKAQAQIALPKNSNKSFIKNLFTAFNLKDLWPFTLSSSGSQSSAFLE